MLLSTHAHHSSVLLSRAAPRPPRSHNADNVHLVHQRPASSCRFAAPNCRAINSVERNLGRIRAMSPQQQQQQQQQEQQSSGLSDSPSNEVFEVVAEKILEEEEDGIENDGNDNNDKKRFDRSGGDSEDVPTLPEDLDFAQRHPMDPHKPNFSALLPESLRPYPSFEGWFVRMLDPERQFSAAVILATNYATDESQVTLLFAPGEECAGRAGGRDGVTRGYTYALAVKTKDAKFSKKENDEEWGDDRGEKPEGFEWEAHGIGRLAVTPHNIDLDFTVEGYHFKAHLTKELLWDAHSSEKGPEGWARYVTIIPTHWYVFSLGSAVEYSFSNPEKQIRSEGSAFGHVEKNWGQTFPAGHVWLQAFSPDNISQICFSGAYFKTPGEKLSSPYVFVLGYRSPELQLDFRTNDVGIVFKDIDLRPRDSGFSITAVGPSHSVELTAFAPFDTFSESVLAPMSKVDWEPACRETFVATAEIKVYEHLAWGIPGTKNLVETRKFVLAALEFGEDLLGDASDGGGGQQG